MWVNLIKIMREGYSLCIGIKTGWNQHQDVVFTEPIPEGFEEIYDTGITFGQKLRNPLDNQSKREGYKLGMRKKKRGKKA